MIEHYAGGTLARPLADRVSRAGAALWRLIVAPDRWLRWGPLLIVAAYAGMLNLQSLSSDELYAVYFSGQDLSYLLSGGWRVEPNPPFYWFVLHGWMAVAGRSEIAIRLPSLMAFAATLPLVTMIARKCGLGRVAPLACLLFGLSALPADYAVTARAYALWVFFIAIALLGYLDCVERVRARRGDGAIAFLWATRWYVVGALTALYTHAATVPFLAAANIVFAGCWLARGRPVPAAIGWVVAQFIVVAVAIPEIAMIMVQIHAAIHDWIAPTSAHSLLVLIVQLFGGYFPLARPAVVTLLLALTASLVALAAARHWRRDTMLRYLLLLALVEFVVYAVVNVFVHSLIPRTLLWFLIPTSIAAAAALARIEGAALRRGLTAAILLLSAANTAAFLWWSPDQKWREFFAVIAGDIAPGDIIVVAGDTPVAEVMYYLPGGGRGRTYRWTSVDFPMSPTTPGAILDARIAPVPPVTERDLVALLRSGSAVWLIDRRFENMELVADGRLQQALRPVAKPTLRRQYGPSAITRFSGSGERAARRESDRL